MNQSERRIFLIEYLLKEKIHFVAQKVPTERNSQEELLRLQ